MNKPAFQRDWTFYLNNRTTFNFCGCTVPETSIDPDGVSAMEAFYVFDSRGKIQDCREPKLFREILICKKSINFHIKMWAHGYNDTFTGVPELLGSFIEPPDWVEIALRKQIYKHNFENKK